MHAHKIAQIDAPKEVVIGKAKMFFLIYILILCKGNASNTKFTRQIKMSRIVNQLLFFFILMILIILSRDSIIHYFI